METHLESFWIFAIFFKYKSLSSLNTILALLFMWMAWLIMSVPFWAFPGGPPWGKHHCKKRDHQNTNPIPGPRGFPILGSMNLMTKLAHRNLTNAADRLGARRLMAFSLGDTRVIITCNPDVAKEILHSSVFADRPIKESAYSLMFNRAIGFAPYGMYWTTLRRIAATHLFCPKQVCASEPQRFQLAAQMLSIVAERGCNARKFCVRDVLRRASLNNMMCSVFGRKYKLGELNKETEELSQLVEEGYDLLGKLNWSDHLPWLAGFDLQSIRYRCSKLAQRVNVFVGRIIKEHRAQTCQKNLSDFADVLLSLQGPDKLSDHDMIAVLWEMIFRGTDTVAVLIEWVLARMVLHPEIQSKVHADLDKVVGKSRPLMETDIHSIVYLTAVIKEVLRLHPPGPLLSWARLAITDTVVDGYHVPAGTTAMVNMWAITRCPRVWSDPLEFSPGRFVSSKDADVNFSVLGSDLRLAPFGSGRRSCPGKSLGLATVSFWVGTLLHEFEWKQAEPVDLSDVLKLSCEMANPLTVQVHPRRR
ncbi:cytochrome P450 78A9-like [Argentina anserina]|uniref:cytochrome P450 78A9-like n=1 Tax=Argentina anserina TaxID=57926 RepID=UPI0021763CCF|nr:cytochrome P450 78A9-like [Potentilla anserina]